MALVVKFCQSAGGEEKSNEEALWLYHKSLKLEWVLSNYFRFAMFEKVFILENHLGNIHTCFMQGLQLIWPSMCAYKTFHETTVLLCQYYDCNNANVAFSS